MKNITGPWKNIVINKFELVQNNGKRVEKLKEISFGNKIFYPFCKILDLEELFQINNTSIKKIFISFAVDKNRNYGVSILLEENNRKSTRTLMSSKFAYNGPVIENQEMKNPRRISYSFQLFQTIFNEKNKNYLCHNYPTEKFKDFGECDQKFVSKEVRKKFNVTPFWATEDLAEVTKLKLVRNANDDEFMDFATGETESSCLNPCIQTKVQF